jgi:hypothetical protein
MIAFAAARQVGAWLAHDMRDPRVVAPFTAA